MFIFGYVVRLDVSFIMDVSSMFIMDNNLYNNINNKNIFYYYIFHTLTQF